MPQPCSRLIRTLAAAVLLAATGTPAYAQSLDQQATVKVVAPTRVGAVGTNVGLSIEVDDASNLAGFQFVLSVDAQILSPISAEKTAFLTESGREISCADATIEAAAVRFTCVTLRDSPPGVDGSGTLAVATLKITGHGTSPLALSNVKLVHPDGSLLPSRALDGKLTIGGGSSFPRTRAVLGTGAGALLLALLTAFIWRRRNRRLDRSNSGGIPTDST